MLRAAAVAEKRGVEMRVAQLPTGMDPADAVQRLGPAAAREALERPLHLRRFRVQRVLDKADMTSTGGRETALDELRREFAPVAPGALRDELLNLVADAYNRPGDVVAAWLGADPRGAAAASRAPAAEARREAERGAVMSARSMDPLGHAERALLAQAVATPAAGEALLRELDLDEYFSSALTRAAAGHLRDHITDPMNGLRQEDAQLGAFLAEIAVRATQLRNSTGILDAEARNLDLLHLERRIAESRTRGSGDVAALMIRREELRHRRDLLIERAMQETETAER